MPTYPAAPAPKTSPKAAMSATPNQPVTKIEPTSSLTLIDSKTGELTQDGRLVTQGPPAPKAKAALPKATGVTEQKAASAAVTPATAGSVRNLQQPSVTTTEAADKGEVPAAAYMSEVKSLNQTIAAMQAVNAQQTLDITNLKAVTNQLGQSTMATSTAAGATNANTGVANTSTSGGTISKFLTSTTGKVVVVAAIAGGIFFYVRSRGGIKGLNFGGAK